MSNINCVLIIIFTAFLSAVSQVLLNLSNRKDHKDKIFEYLNPYVISSYILLFVALVLNIFALKYIELKIGHAIAASTYAFVLILSRIFLKEKITPKKIIGNTLIIVGIIIFTL